MTDLAHAFLCVCLPLPAMSPTVSSTAIILLKELPRQGEKSNNTHCKAYWLLGCCSCLPFGSVGTAHSRINACRNANNPLQ